MKPHLAVGHIDQHGGSDPYACQHGAIRGGAKRPDSGRGWVLEDLAAGPGVRAGWREDRPADP